MSALARIDEFFRPEAPPERLAVVRILVGTYSLVWLLIRLPHLLSYANQPAAQLRPIGVMSWLTEPLPAWLVYISVVLCVPLAGAFLVGAKYRVMAPLFAFCFLCVLTYSNSFGMIFHTENLLMMHVIVLALVPAADAVSWDAKQRGSSPEPDPRYGAALRTMCVAVVLVYLLAGIAKVQHSGLAYFDGDTLRNYVAWGNMRKVALGSTHSPLGVFLLQFSGFFAFLVVSTMVLELGAPAALLHRRIALGWCVALWGFHAGVLAVMAIAFVYPLTGVALACFFDAERLLTRWPLRKLWPEAALRNTNR